MRIPCPFESNRFVRTVPKTGCYAKGRDFIAGIPGDADLIEFANGRGHKRTVGITTKVSSPRPKEIDGKTFEQVKSERRHTA